nr:Pentatricopeptide repeat-containing protein, chloroplastic [Ipomoea batatas]
MLIWYTVSAEDTLANTDSVLPGWSPVELLHTAVTDERSIEGGEVIAGDYDGDAGILLLVVHAGELDIGWVISDVHKCGIHHLVVDSVLGSPAHSSGSCVKIVDEEDAHVPLSDDFCCLTFQEVLGDMDNKLVHESRGNVKSIQSVINIVPEIKIPNSNVIFHLNYELLQINKYDIEDLLTKALTDIFIRAKDSVVSASTHRSLEERVNQSLSPGDILLVIRDVLYKSLPPVLIGLFLLINLGLSCLGRLGCNPHLPAV